jgi:hypothetical protein
MTKSASSRLESQRSRALSSRGAPVLPHNPTFFAVLSFPKRSFQDILLRRKFLRRRFPTVTAPSLFQFFLKEPSSLCSSKGFQALPCGLRFLPLLLSSSFFVVKVVRRDPGEFILRTLSGSWILDGALIRFL